MLYYIQEAHSVANNRNNKPGQTQQVGNGLNGTANSMVYSKANSKLHFSVKDISKSEAEGVISVKAWETAKDKACGKANGTDEGEKAQNNPQVHP